MPDRSASWSLSDLPIGRHRQGGSLDMNAAGAISAYTYQSALSRTGSADQALTHALATSQSLVAASSALFATQIGPINPMPALSGDATGQASTALPFASLAPPGNGNDHRAQVLNALLGSTNSALFSSTGNLPVSAAVLSPASTEALVRYAYDQGQNPSTSTNALIASAQQSRLSAGLNLLA